MAATVVSHTLAASDVAAAPQTGRPWLRGIPPSVNELSRPAGVSALSFLKRAELRRRIREETKKLGSREWRAP